MGTVNVEIKGSDPALGFVWTPEELAQMVDNQLATLSPYETTTFEVTGFVEGCSYTDAVLVAWGRPLRCPTFSPNNDDFNDTFDIYGLSQFEFSTIEIFDRGDNRCSGRFLPQPLGRTFRVAVPQGRITTSST